MKKILFSLYHHLPDKFKRIIRLYSKSYNDVAGGGQTLFKDRIEREMNAFLKDDKGEWNAIRKDIKRCWLKYGSSPEEYFLFGFRKLNKKERGKFITDYEKDMTLKKRMGLEIFAKELRDKYCFYCLTEPFFRRRAFKMTEETKESDFVKFAVETKDLFIKPDNQSRGRGAYKVSIANESDAFKEFASLKESGIDWMIEEVIVQCEETKKWNSSSVNTVRIPTFLNKNGFFVGVPFFRTGRAGACVDNAGGGGIFANIDAKTGVVYTDGIDEAGNFYKVHPDSGLVFKGYQIPKWNELLKTTEKVHKECMPHHLYIGWDFALTNDGWVLIEGNWGQFVSQYADHIGFRERFVKYMSAEFYK